MLRPGLVWLCAGLWAWAGAAAAEPAAADTIADATCRIVESAARAAQIPVDFLTRLVWTESRFRATAISPAGAQGIAQFMPGTAAERGLANPYDLETAIPAAAALLADLRRQFGNFGLAAAAYNAGAARVSAWLDGPGSLPVETQNYVFTITGRTAADWVVQRREGTPAASPTAEKSCLTVTALLRTEEAAEPAPIAPWGIQLAGNFSKAIALAAFERSRGRFARILGGGQPMILGGRLLSRGTRRFYRVLVPVASRTEADRMCRQVVASGGACVVVRT